MIQKATAAKTQRKVTPVSGAIHKGNKYRNAFTFNPLNVFETTIAKLASDAFSGNLFCLVSSVIYAVYLILSNRFLKRTGPYTLMRYTFSGAAVSSLIVMAFVGYEASLTTPPLHFWPIALLLFVLIFPTVISYLLIPTGLKYLSTTVVAIYGYLILVVASIVSFLVGQDRFSWEQLGAMLLICVGVYWVEIAENNGRERKRPHSPSIT